MNDLARHLCSVMGIDARRVDVSALVANQGLRGEIFPTYNQDRDPDNSLVSPHASYVLALKCLDTQAYVSRSYRMLEERLPDHEPNPARGEIFDKALADHRAATHAAARVNPYGDLPPDRYWRTGVVDSPRVFLDGFSASARPVIGKQTRVATAGSCFAQHISRVLSSKGLNYYVAEAAPPGMSSEEAQRRSYGVFSARYGNLYTARQLLQLAQRPWADCNSPRMSGRARTEASSTHSGPTSAKPSRTGKTCCAVETSTWKRCGRCSGRSMSWSSHSV
jgi:hypothetical protein